MQNTIYEAPKTKDEVLTEARRLYSKWTEEQGVHSNRYPGFYELSLAAQQDWQEKAYASLTKSNPSPVVPKLEIVPAKAKTAWPTNDEVYAELIKSRSPDQYMYVSTNAVNDVMAAVNKLSCANLQKDVFVQGMQAACDGVIKERDALNIELGLLSKERDELFVKLQAAIRERDIARINLDDNIEAICSSYESGIGHGLKKDGLDLSKTPHSNPVMGKAYQIGYEEGDRRAVVKDEPVVPAEAPGFPSMLDWELACDVSFKGETLRRIVTIAQLVEMMKSNRNIVIHHGTEKTGVRAEEQEVEISLPAGWRLMHEGTANLIGAISAAIQGSESEERKCRMISVRKFLERLDYTHGPVKLKLKKDANGTIKFENGRAEESRYTARCD